MTRRMFDSISLASLPPGAELYAGYDDGNWPDAAEIAANFAVPVLRITVYPTDNEGDMLDVEKGNAQPNNAPGWVSRRRQAGHLGPLVYVSESQWPDVRAAFADQGVEEPGYVVAAYPGEGAVIPAGAVGHQWVDYGGYDESVMVDYLPGIDPAPVPQPQGEPQMDAYDPMTGGVWKTDENGDLYALYGAPFIQGLNQHPDFHAGTEESGGSAPCVGISYWGGAIEDGIVYFTRPAAGGGIPGTPFSAYRWKRDGTPA